MADILFNCSNCQTELVVDAEGAGLEIECPNCGTALIIPDGPIIESSEASEPETNLIYDTIVLEVEPTPEQLMAADGELAAQPEQDYSHEAIVGLNSLTQPETAKPPHLDQQPVGATQKITLPPRRPFGSRSR